MNTLKRLMVSLAGGGSSVRRGAAKVRLQSAPACEALEGRQLLNAAWAGPADAADQGMRPADVHIMDKGPAGGGQDVAPPALSDAAKAEWKALHADEKTLAGELKADTKLTPLVDAVKADQALIRKTLGLTAPAGADHSHFGFIKANDAAIAPSLHGGPGHGHGMHRPGMDMGMGMGETASLPAALVTKLEAKGITAAQIEGFNDDLKAVQTETRGVDPALQAKIKTERAAFMKDAPAPPVHFDHIMMMSKAKPATA